MLAAAEAAAAGWRITYLGADLPASSILEGARRSEATVVGLSLVHPKDDPNLPAQLEALRAGLSPDVVLLVGGAATRNYAAALRRVGALVVTDLAALRSTLGTLALEPRTRS
jgi:methanogenic corrinoid protein MtbC1